MGSGRPAAQWQSEVRNQKNWWGKKRRALWWSLVPIWNPTHSVIWFEVQHQLLQCCFIVPHAHSEQRFSGFFDQCLILQLFVVAPAGAVRPVLRVDEHLHLELHSQRGLRNSLSLHFYGFNLCLRKKIIVSRYAVICCCRCQQPHCWKPERQHQCKHPSDDITVCCDVWVCVIYYIFSCRISKMRRTIITLAIFIRLGKPAKLLLASSMKILRTLSVGNEKKHTGEAGWSSWVLVGRNMSLGGCRGNEAGLPSPPTIHFLQTEKGQ